ncbi:hypothetical protein GUITHDRAFT_151904 [Guillardia theta CCMP2712]|uniref:Uncharacterized protein n=1 Tax=Guillardia theta (strain CCMP2712) TaxID=905079 RepID=L1JI57_GUITC|nr:hypothetical protein GUITHDRAFT_151904 [Guillardia theta CCMP2712]EKX48007.1 hypothetical protein GUITHDRAFT_151904 [Guillardia theta CCMP2712]|eukprot:XP_005834987.1 hypothetical protein GUITHDRAFT_151904 [Guillardia theta CCMP2712]
MGSNFSGDSLDCLQHLLGEDNSLGSLLSSRQGVFPCSNSRQALVEKGGDSVLSPAKRTLEVQEGGEQEGYGRASKQLKMW